MRIVRLKILAVFLMILSPSTLYAGPTALVEKYLGWKAYEGKKYTQAQEHFSKSLVEDPKDPRVAYNLGNAYYRSGNFGKASESFLRGISVDDLNLRERSFYNLGNSLYRSGEWEKAVDAYEKALKLDPKDPEAKLNLEFVKKKIQEKKQQEQKPPPSEQAKQDQKQDQGGGQGDSEEKKPNQGDSPSEQSQKQNQDSPQDQNQAENQPKPQSGQENKEPSKGLKPKPQDSQAQAQNNPPQGNQNQPSQEGPPQKPEDSKGSSDSESPPEKKEAPQEGKLEAKKEDSQKPEKADRSQTEEGQGKLSQQEAEHWLGSINEDPTKIIKDQIAKKLGRSRRPEKDW